MIKLAVLASGRGSNFLSIQKEIEAGTLDASIEVLISDRENAPALELARQHGMEAVYIPYDKNDRQAFEEQAAAHIRSHGCELIILAGFMRIVTPWLIEAFPGKMLNIHPSLLPSFRGMHAQQQAVDFGVKISGCTVHVVTPELDDGPIIAQCAVPVLNGDTGDTLSERIIVEEHRLYPEAIRIFAAQAAAQN